MTFEDLGYFELLEAGNVREEAELETVLRALSAWGIDAAVVPGDLPSRSPTISVARASRSPWTRGRSALAGA